MNHFRIYWIVFFVSHCSAQNEHSESSLNISSENAIRCDTYHQNHEIQYTWVIGNFSSYETNDRYREVFSPNLQAPTTDRYAWKIKLTPNGSFLDHKNRTGKPIGLDVYLSEESATKSALARYNISLINREKEVLLHRDSPMEHITRGYSKYWRDFCPKDDFLKKRILQNDTLILSINIAWSGGFSHEIYHKRETSPLSSPIPKTTIVQCIPSENLDSMLENPKLADMIFSSTGSDYRFETCVQIHELKYIWAIHNFNLYENDIVSPKLYASTTDRYEWQINVTTRDENWVGLYVQLSSESKVNKTFAKYDISIINHHNEVIHKRESPIKKLASGQKNYWEFCKIDDCFRKHLLKNDTLTLLIRIKWISESSIRNNSVSLPQTTYSPVPTSNPAIINHSNFSENFESMLENPRFADVIFVTNGSNYPAHKFILAARSAVFATMFQQKDTKDGKSRKIRVNVIHINEQVLRAMLRYIYTGKCENFAELAYDELFEVAAKYGLNGLKKICEQNLGEALSAQNAAEMLAFAKKHHIDKLKFKARELLKNRSNQKLNTTIAKIK
ncbi:speckle-type POZ protein B-like [Planococcus citri]|uniref:speckle-type POZ protein B-like n=1 Tax=Planococcus citri TaxID=170843 RepID=UPI0031F94790